mmetsp:Transcript_1965/g.4489  ORF Transcript_1965/g.4489 Transcript_1965/m.4489 type:complete len:343 (-) Transcript_1965:73-1101(-)
MAMPPATAFGGTYASFAALNPETAPLWPDSSAGASQYGSKSAMPQRRRRRWNFIALFLAVFLPWLIFVSVFAVMSFHFPRTLEWSSFVGSAQLSFAICGICFLIVVALGCAAICSWRRPKFYSPQEPTWYTVLFLSTLIAWVAGMEFGDLNYRRNMQPWGKLINSGAYNNVDPVRVHGSSVADAGRISFKVGSKVEAQMAMAFTDDHSWCIAPFAWNESITDARYDFWAVGLDCCPKNHDERINWFCNPGLQHRLSPVVSMTGLRYTGDERGFRFALQQAEAKFNITVADPVFLVRTEDADAVVDSYQDRGIKNFLSGIFGHFVFQLCLVACTIATLSWLGW